MPQPLDVRLAAALVVKGCATREAIEQCLRLLERAENAGKTVSLERVVVSRGLLSESLVRAVRLCEGLIREGERIGPYQLLSKVGEGGMSTVFKAQKAGATQPSA